jgi:hypothetical protein
VKKVDTLFQYNREGNPLNLFYILYILDTVWKGFYAFTTIINIQNGEKSKMPIEVTDEEIVSMQPRKKGGRASKTAKWVKQLLNGKKLCFTLSSKDTDGDMSPTTKYNIMKQLENPHYKNTLVDGQKAVVIANSEFPDSTEYVPTTRED